MKLERAFWEWNVISMSFRLTWGFFFFPDGEKASFHEKYGFVFELDKKR